MISKDIISELPLRIDDYAMPVKPNQRGMEIQGSHPIHGSFTGFNFSINLSKDRYYCYRCSAGGDTIDWIAVMLGLQSETDIAEHGISEVSFQQVINYLWTHGYSERLAERGYSHSLNPLPFAR